jgi:6-phosphogluconate dehydrogenase
MEARGDIAVVGLAVMGQNLILNMNDHGFRVVAFNRTTAKVDEFTSNEAKGTNVVGAHSLAEAVALLKPPRRVLLMVKAGAAVDDFIGQLVPHLVPGDIVLDGGNSHFLDTARRCRELEAKGLLFVGAGVSGGEEGARHGPSIMPGGHAAAWPHVAPILQAIAAKVDGVPCCDWVGSGGAGHYVKMVHNGIEYGDMQIIGEAYHVMRDGLKLSYPQMRDTFAEWNAGVLDSYLVEITRDVLGTVDSDGAPLVEHVLDAAGQKGTGKWTVADSMEHGIPATLMSEAVYARCVSALKEERSAAAKILSGPPASIATGDGNDRRAFVDALRDALYAAKIVSYAQGFMLLRAAARSYDWHLDYGRIALLWRGGCIIRSRFLGKIRDAFERDSKLVNLLLDPYFKAEMDRCQKGWRQVVASAVSAGIPLPALSSALAFYDSYRCERLPANLLQAQRDYFGAHTYERTDRPRGEFHHTNWTGRGGTTSSSSYTV